MIIFISIIIILILFCYWFFTKTKDKNNIYFNGIPSYIKASDYPINYVRHLDEILSINHQAINEEIKEIAQPEFNNTSWMPHEQQWYPLWLQCHGKKTTYLEKLPILSDIIKNIPNIEMCYLSFFPAGATITNNQSPYHTLYKYQYMLSGDDNDLGLNINGFDTTWKLGQGFVWDDTKPYAVWNNGTKTRVTLCISFKSHLQKFTDIYHCLHYQYNKMFSKNNNNIIMM